MISIMIPKKRENTKVKLNSALGIMFPLLLYLLLSLIFQVNVLHAEDNNQIHVYGFVVDYIAGKPLERVKIGVINWAVDYRRVEGSFREFVKYDLDIDVTFFAETNASGLFETYISRDLPAFSRETVIFLAYYDNETTPGIDYVPSCIVASTRDLLECRLTFSLLPGATIILVDVPLIYPNEEGFLCTLIDERNLLRTVGAITRFYGSWHNRTRVIFAPAGLGVRIRIFIWEEERDVRGRFSFILPSNDSYLLLEQGEQITLNLKEKRLYLDAYETIPGILERNKEMAEIVGVLAAYEKFKISISEGLLENAKTLLQRGDYIGAQAYLYESYVTLRDVERSLISMFQNSVASLFVLTPFSGVISSILGAFLYRDKRKRALIGLFIYTLIVTALYYTYPGYMLIQSKEHNPLVGTILEPLFLPLLLIASFIFGFILINAPYTYGEKSDRRAISVRSAIVASFALAAENLKRRKLRSILIMSMILISVLSFINLTSFSYEEGFVIEKVRGTPPSEGILVSQPPSGPMYPYGALDERVIEWLNGYYGSSLVVPLVKNLPQAGMSPTPLDKLFTPSKEREYTIFGVLGIKPSLESSVTGIDGIVGGEDMGRFLADNDFNGILISQEAKNALQIKVNDTIVFSGRNFTVVGIFESARLAEITDLNGEPILPQMVRIQPVQGGASSIPVYVYPKDVVIMLDTTALQLPYTAITRVVIKTARSDDSISMAKKITLLFPMIETFVSINNEIMHLYVGYHTVSYGFNENLMLLTLISLNIGVMLLNSVYERRHEIVTLSTIGFNPSQISAVFICEALIIAIIAGGLGYILSLINYYMLFVLAQQTLIMKYKAEAFWAIFAIAFSIISSVFGSLIPALRAPLKITPSLLRRFTLSYEKGEGDSWVIEIPVKITYNELKDFFPFMERRMRDLSGPASFEEKVNNIRVEGDITEPQTLRLLFSYTYDPIHANTENKLFAEKRGDIYVIKLSSRAISPWKRESIWQTASFVRRLSLEYTEKEKIGFKIEEKE